MKIKSESDSILADYPTPASSTRAGSVITKQEPVDLTLSDDEGDIHSNHLVSSDGIPRDNSPAHPRTTSAPEPDFAPRIRQVSLRPALPMESFRCDGLEAMSGDVKDLIETIEKLKNIGLKSIEAELPELVLVGDQSAGKSSLMGALTEINLPQSDSMCTRCPTNIKTSASEGDSWSCMVSLRLKYQYVHRKEKKAIFPNWKESEGRPEILPFKKIYHRHELEGLLDWAKRALLNPGEDYKSFIPDTPEFQARSERVRRDGIDRDEAFYSPNVIEVDILGPGLPELSFYDLPGLFHAAEDSASEYLVPVYETMTKHYINHKNALIICAMTMKNDPALSRAKALISEKKVEERCIGVLTMPDLLQKQSKAAQRDYDKILHGKAYLLMDYFVTKQPDPEQAKELHMKASRPGGLSYHEYARMTEEKFFDSNELWTGEWSQFRSKCGTQNIRKYLSKKFASIILKSLPDLKKKIIDQTKVVEDELNDLPELPNQNVQYVVRERLADFSIQIRAFLDGTSSPRGEQFHGGWSQLIGQWTKTIEAMRPGVVCISMEEIDAVEMAKDDTMILEIDSEDDASSQQTPSVGAKRRFETFDPSPCPTPSKKQRPGASVFRTPTQQQYEQMSSSQGSNSTREIRRHFLSDTVYVKRYRQVDFGPFYQPYLGWGHKAIEVDKLHQRIKESSRTGKPEEDPIKVKELYALKFIGHWDQPLETFLYYTFKMLREHVMAILDEVFRKHIETELYRQSRRIVDRVLTELQDEQRRASFEFYKTEKAHLFTINTESFEHYKKEGLDAIKTQRFKHRRDICYAKQKKAGKLDTLKGKTEAEMKNNLDEEKVNSILGPDKFARELSTAAYVRGYYTAARLRFTDSVCANLHARYFSKVRDTLAGPLGGLLEREFKLNDGDSTPLCITLLADNQDIPRRRAKLQEKMQQLTESCMALGTLESRLRSGEDSAHRYNGNIDHEYGVERETAQSDITMAESGIDLDRSARVESFHEDAAMY